MAKSNVEIEQAHALIERVAQELGLLVSDTAFGKKVQGPGNKHRLYVQRGRFLGRIDFTIPLDPADPAYVQLKDPNGSIRCHVTPDLTQLERCLRMLGDGALDTQVPNKPRPFAASKAPSPRRPKAIAAAIPLDSLSDPAPPPAIDPARQLLADRIARIHTSARAARIRMVLENPERYGNLTEAEAEAVVDGRGRVDTADVIDVAQNAMAAATKEAIAESGIEVSL